jgi:hypothetical protein
MKQNNINGGVPILIILEYVIPNRLHNGGTSYVRCAENHEVWLDNRSTTLHALNNKDNYI